MGSGEAVGGLRRSRWGAQGKPLGNLSTYKPVFVEEHQIFRHPSTYRAVFVEKHQIFRNLSTYKACFCGGTSDFPPSFSGPHLLEGCWGRFRGGNPLIVVSGL